MPHKSYVALFGFSPDGKNVVSISFDNTVRVWNASTGKEIAHMTHGGECELSHLSPDGMYVVSGGCDLLANSICTQGSARVWEASTGKEIARMTHDKSVSSVAFSPDGRYVVSGWCEQRDTRRLLQSRLCPCVGGEQGKKLPA